MSRTIILDTSPLSLLSNPKRPPETVSILAWAVSMRRAGHRFVVPAIADYEVRRELERAGKINGLAALDAWNNVAPDRYLPLTDAALRLGSKLWARARNMGVATADPKELDGDVLIAAQALDLGIPLSDFVIATVNVGHLSLFVPADLWSNIVP
jgi:predicted nucleic acid-binding protein